MSMNIPQAIARLREIPNDLDIRGRLEAFELCAPDYKGRDSDISMVKSVLWQGQMRMHDEALRVIEAIAVASSKSLEALRPAPVKA